MAILHGRNLIIKAGGVAIAAAKSCDINVQCEEIETASPSTGAWRTALTGRKSWSVSTNQLVRSIVRPTSMVGTTVSLSMEIADDMDALAFNGFVDNPTVQIQSLAELPARFLWDTTRNRFLGESSASTVLNRRYYLNWNPDPGFLSPADYATFKYNGNVYFFHNNALTIEKMTGNANVVNWRATGTLGNLAQGSFQFMGKGALTNPTT